MGTNVQFASEKAYLPVSGAGHYVHDHQFFEYDEVEDMMIAAKAANVCELENYRRNRIFHEQIDLILASLSFRKSPVLIKLLSYLFSETVAGRGHLLKSYTVAVDALGRSANFDAQVDSYPRVQIARLRKVLEAYYATEGAAFDPCIHIPLGSYEVELAPRAQAYPNLAPVTPIITAPPAAEQPGAAIAPVKQPRAATPARTRIVAFAMVLVAVAELLAAVPVWRTGQAGAPSCSAGSARL